MANPFLELENPEAWGPGSFEMALPLIEAVGIKPGMRVLEVGAGSGQIAIALALHWNAQVFTLEPWRSGNDIQARAAAAGVWDRVIALKTRAQKLRFADETFDAVVSIGSFEMIGDERPQALEQMVRVAKRGARVGWPNRCVCRSRFRLTSAISIARAFLTDAESNTTSARCTGPQRSSSRPAWC